jgi:hypothetical protein
MNFLEENNSCFSVNEYQYKLDAFIINSNRKAYDTIYEFIKKWLEIKQIKIKSLISINNFSINNLPTQLESHDYYITNSNKISEILKIKNIPKADLTDEYNYFFKFLRKILLKINYVLVVRKKYLTIKSK